jgi:hypothetical protein
MMKVEYPIHLPNPHQKQQMILDCKAKRKIIKAGRRSGKTVLVAIDDVLKFLEGKRILYAVPTSDQLNRWWQVITSALAEPIERGLFYKNETEHIIELKGTEQRLRGKTAWSADTLRGDYADELILDEWQLCDEDAWETVGAPMMLDHNGNATFIYTPPSLHSRSVSKARDPQHAAKMYKQFHELMKSGDPRYAAFHFTSHENPYISAEALQDITKDMTSLAYRMEIMAEDVDEAPGALWTRKIIDDYRVISKPDLARLVVGVDPSATSTGDEAGIVSAGYAGGELYILADDSLQGSPKVWASQAVLAYHRYNADAIVAESNNGGEMVRDTILTVDPKVNVRLVHASRGKATRAEPVSALYEHGKAHHVGTFPALEDEMCIWIPGDASPNRMDALVWAATDLMKLGMGVEAIENPFYS